MAKALPLQNSHKPNVNNLVAVGSYVSVDAVRLGPGQGSDADGQRAALSTIKKQKKQKE